MYKNTKNNLKRIYGAFEASYSLVIDKFDGLSVRERMMMDTANTRTQSGEYNAALKIYLSMPERYIQRRLLYPIAYAYWEISEPQYVPTYLLRIPERERNLQYYQLLSSAYERLQRHGETARVLEALIRRKLFKSISDKDKAWMLYKLSINLQKIGKNTQAKNYLKKTTEHAYRYEVAKYGEGILHYKMKNWSAAVEPLENEVRKHKTDARFLSVVARCCMYDGQLEKAKTYYKDSLTLDYSHADRHIELAECLQIMGETTDAIFHYEEAVARAGRQPMDYAIKLADAYTAVGKHLQASKVLHEGSICDRTYLMPESCSEEYKSNKYNWYATYYEEIDIDDKLIVYESMSGEKMADNPLALFEELLKDKRFSSFKHVWSVQSIDSVPKKYLSVPNLIFVKRGSKLYMKYLASAKYLICNSKFPGYFIRKQSQQYLNTWHGTAYKKLGVHTSKTLVGEGFTARNFLQASHIITPNKHMTNVQQDAYQIRELYEGRIAETGYPRIDMTLNVTPKMRDQIRNELGIVQSKPTVLYAPTWRSGNKFDTVRLEYDLKKLSNLNCNVVFMGHHIMQRLIKKIEGLQGVIFTDSLVNSNRLLSIADILVTDYSSIFYDFMVTGKPIVHYLYDINKYLGKRGLYFDTDKLPGEIAYKSEDLINAVSRCIGKDYYNPENYEKMKEEFCPHEDGNVSKRVIDWFFFGRENGVKLTKSGTRRKKKLFVLGDVRSIKDIDKKSLESLSSDDQEFSNYILSKSASTLYPERIKIAERLTAHATILGYVSNNGSTAFEKANNDVQSIASRDYRRCFGETKFDEIVNLDKPSEYWTAFSQ